MPLVFDPTYSIPYVVSSFSNNIRMMMVLSSFSMTMTYCSQGNQIILWNQWICNPFKVGGHKHFTSHEPWHQRKMVMFFLHSCVDASFFLVLWIIQIIIHCLFTISSKLGNPSCLRPWGFQVSRASFRHG